MFAASKTASVSGGYQISRSLRFNSADSAYLNRTPASAGNRRTWTFSTWLKRSKSGDFRTIFSAATDTSNLTIIRFKDDDKIEVRSATAGSTVFQLVTTQVFRDYSAWYHFVLAVDTTNATGGDRVRLYVNGSEVTTFDTDTIPTQNADSWVNNNILHEIARQANNASNYYQDGYMTEMYLIDGSQLTPSSFGETNAQTGVWQPKAYSGSYGTNGFYLNFSDNSNTTAATLGKDYSGNSNNWTPNNFSVTAGAGNDSLVDSPTSYGTDTGVGGTVRGNYATMNPLVVNKPNLTNGNLDADGSDLKTAISTMGVSSGKWYWEVLIGSGTNTPNMGVTSYANDNADPGVYLGVGRSYVSSGGGSGVYKPYTGTSTTANSAFSNANTAGATIGFALDCNAGTLAYYVNNVLGYTDSTIATGTLLYPMTCNFNSTLNNYRNTSFNFGQRAFNYTAPSGYKALCTQNLPTPTIGATTATQAGKYFNTVLYTANGGTLNVTGVGFQPDWVWLKDRVSATWAHNLFDAVRGVNLPLSSNLTAAESTRASTLTSFNSDGFSLGNDPSYAGTNISPDTYVAWNWKANGSGSTNTAGSITSTVSANTTSGFSVVTWTGNGSAGQTIGHGLGVAPSFYFIKQRNGSTYGWIAYHSALGANKYLLLNTTNAGTTDTDMWNNTAPTSNVFSLSGSGGNAPITNPNTGTMVAYCFAEVAGYSKFGSYTGNGSADGPFVYCGFRPRYIMVKGSGNSSNWTVIDTARDSYNACKSGLYSNLSAAESDPGPFDILSNGFKIRHTYTDSNGSGIGYIFAAFAEAPLKYSLAR